MTDSELALLCLQSYLPGATIEIGSDLAVKITAIEDKVVVAFRGTANMAGWVRDLDVLPKSHHLIGYCHSGFLAGGCALWAHMDLPTDKEIIFTGHSLGGALAIILGALRIAAGERVDQLVTFGAPRAGFSRLAEIWGPKAVRQYRRGNDPVPTVPFELLAFPYRHAREPLIGVGKPTDHDWESHAIDGYQRDVA